MFSSKVNYLLLGNPTFNEQEARPNVKTHANNYLIEKPQYSLSYNESKKRPNWVSWQLNQSWLGNLPSPTQNVPPDYPGFDDVYPCVE